MGYSVYKQKKLTNHPRPPSFWFCSPPSASRRGAVPRQPTGVLVSTVEIAKFRYENLETRPAIADTGIYLKTSGPGFFDADFYQRSYATFTPTPASSPMPALPLTTLPPVPVHWGWSAEV